MKKSGKRKKQEREKSIHLGEGDCKHKRREILQLIFSRIDFFKARKNQRILNQVFPLSFSISSFKRMTDEKQRRC